MVEIKKELTIKEKIELACLIITALADVVTAIAALSR